MPPPTAHRPRLTRRDCDLSITHSTPQLQHAGEMTIWRPLTVDDLLVGEDGAEIGAPVDKNLLLESEPCHPSRQQKANENKGNTNDEPSKHTTHPHTGDTGWQAAKHDKSSEHGYRGAKAKESRCETAGREPHAE